MDEGFVLFIFIVPSGEKSSLISTLMQKKLSDKAGEKRAVSVQPIVEKITMPRCRTIQKQTVFSDGISSSLTSHHHAFRIFLIR
jgi:hypothetical protein